ncbi:hypothetical protein [Paenibacillus jilunlii]|uniref:hypothetical protein n=1 Tax=Paenibacillus jilunlii TaxID=682956 RepID=UPI002010C045|nr:hypothetical protein [Paenibacillus jilunlii]
MASVTVFSTAGAVVAAGASEAGAVVASAEAAGALAAPPVEFALLLLPQADKISVSVKSPIEASFLWPALFKLIEYMNTPPVYVQSEMVKGLRGLGLTSLNDIDSHSLCQYNYFAFATIQVLANELIYICKKTAPGIRKQP